MAEYNVPYNYNYAISSGVTAYVQKLIATNTYDDIVCIGNIIDGRMTFDNEVYEHYSNIFGMDARDRSITLKKNANLILDFDEIVRDNLQFLIGSEDRLTSQTIRVRKVERPTFAGGTCQVNSGDAIYDVVAVLPLSGEDEYTEGATGDYTVTTATGTITLTAGSDIGTTDTVIVYYRVTQSAQRYEIMDDPDITGKLWVVAWGTDYGPGKQLYCPEVEIKPEGDIGLFNKSEPIKGSLNFKLLEQSTTSSFGQWYQW